MEWHDLLSDGYGRVLDFIENVLRGLTEDFQDSHDLLFRVGDGSLQHGKPSWIL